MQIHFLNFDAIIICSDLFCPSTKFMWDSNPGANIDWTDIWFDLQEMFVPWYDTYNFLTIYTVTFFFLFREKFEEVTFRKAIFLNMYWYLLKFFFLPMHHAFSYANVYLK